MKRPILYALLSLILLIIITSCHRQMARVQPSQNTSYHSIVAVDKVEKVQPNIDQPKAVAPDITNQSSAVESDQVVSTNPTIVQQPAVAKKMARLQKLLLKSSATAKTSVLAIPQTKVKRITEDSKGTLGLLGLIFGATSLLLLLVGSGLGILFALAGIVLSILGLRGPRRGMALVGLIISTISLVLLLVVVTLLAIFSFGR